MEYFTTFVLTKYHAQMINMYNMHARMMNFLGVTALEYSGIVSTQFTNSTASRRAVAPQVQLFSWGDEASNPHAKRKSAEALISDSGLMADGLSLTDSSKAQICAARAACTTQLLHSCW